MLRMLVVILLAAVTVSAEDSPLVALAKRTNRKASKTPVITNEMVARSQGRLSMPGGATAAAQAPLIPASMTVAPAAAPPVSQAKSSNVAIPAAAPETVAASTVPYPASTARTVEPQSSIQVVAPTSTVRTVEPTSAAGRIVPQSTAQTIQPASTAQTVQPQSSTPPPQ